MELHRKYDAFIEELDQQIRALEEIHRSDIKCKPECAKCCKVPRTVLPIEASALLRNSKLEKGIKKKVIAQAKKRSNCPFLVDELCTIYAYRPLICRTHGLPLLYFFSENSEYKVSHCELNFLKHDGEFTRTSLLNMETINEKLRLINAELKFSEERVSFSDLEFLSALKVKNQ